MQSDSFIPPDDPSLVRLELMGNLARAARFALVECEQADQVLMNIEAHSSGMFVDVQLLTNGQPIAGWGC